MAKVQRLIIGWFLRQVSGVICTWWRTDCLQVRVKCGGKLGNQLVKILEWNSGLSYAHKHMGGWNRKSPFVSGKQCRKLEISMMKLLRKKMGEKKWSFMLNTERPSTSLAKTLQTLWRWSWDRLVWMTLSFRAVIMGAVITGDGKRIELSFSERFERKLS